MLRAEARGSHCRPLVHVGQPEGTHDAGVEDYRSHSSLSASRSVRALRPGALPIRSSSGSRSRTSVSRPFPSTLTTSSSPAAMPASYSAATGSVTWFLLETRV